MDGDAIDRRVAPARECALSAHWQLACTYPQPGGFMSSITTKQSKRKLNLSRLTVKVLSNAHSNGAWDGSNETSKEDGSNVTSRHASRQEDGSNQTSRVW